MALGLSLRDWAFITLLPFLAVAVVFFSVHAVRAIQHRYPLDYGEAPLVDQAMRLAARQNIYRPDISSPPYTISNYPPLYILSMAPFVKLFDIHYFPVYPVYKERWTPEMLSAINQAYVPIETMAGTGVYHPIGNHAP